MCVIDDFSMYFRELAIVILLFYSIWQFTSHFMQPLFQVDWLKFVGVIALFMKAHGLHFIFLTVFSAELSIFLDHMFLGNASFQ